MLGGLLYTGRRLVDQFLIEQRSASDNLSRNERVGWPGFSPSQILPSRISDEEASGHVMNRTVRRCFLLGDYPVPGMNRLRRGKTAECYSASIQLFFEPYADHTSYLFLVQPRSDSRTLVNQSTSAGGKDHRIASGSSEAQNSKS